MTQVLAHWPQPVHCSGSSSHGTNTPSTFVSVIFKMPFLHLLTQSPQPSQFIGLLTASVSVFF
jgi:hypothetical protein